MIFRLLFRRYKKFLTKKKYIYIYLLVGNEIGGVPKNVEQMEQSVRIKERKYLQRAAQGGQEQKVPATEIPGLRLWKGKASNEKMDSQRCGLEN